ncbi:MAG: hypothetical protein ACOYO1_18885 [Bacteroidales bacterium]
MNELNKIFNDWLNNLTVVNYPNVRGRIIKECLITPYIFLHWKKGITTIPYIYADKLNSIAGKNIFIVPTDKNIVQL